MSNRLRVLALDDDARFLENLQRALQSSHDVEIATEPDEALKLLAASPFHAMLIDYDLGSQNGHEFLDRAREQGSCPPAIVISGVVNLEMATGFLKRRTFGFLQKPISLPELERLLDEVQEANDETSAGFFVIDREARRVTYEGKDIVLSPTEFEILIFFVDSPNKQISRMTLTAHLWGSRSSSRESLDTHLINLKKKLPAFARRLKSVYGAGFCYEE